VDLLDGLAAARDGVVAVERPDRAALLLTGADVLRYLHAVCSQHTESLGQGEAAEALLLSPKGKIEFAFRLAVLDGGVLLDGEAEAAPALAERLERFVFRYDVAVGAPKPGGVSVLGPGADAALARAGLPVPAGAGRAAAASPALVVHRTALGADVVGEAAPAALRALRAAGVEAGPAGLWELLRVERGLPRAGLELTDDVLAEEPGCWAATSTSTRAATRARRRSPGSTTSARCSGAWPACASRGTASRRRRSPSCAPRTAAGPASCGPPCGTRSLAPSGSPTSAARSRRARPCSPASGRPRCWTYRWPKDGRASPRPRDPCGDQVAGNGDTRPSLRAYNPCAGARDGRAGGLHATGRFWGV
jgi:hypothetical protein